MNRLLTAAAAVLLVLSLSPYLRTLTWVLELPSHFRTHIVVTALLVGLIGIARRQALIAGPAAIALAHSLIVLVSVPTAPVSDQPGVTVISQNLRRSNTQTDRFLHLLNRDNADIVVLQEYTPEWHAAISTSSPNYTNVVAVPQRGSFGIAIYSTLTVDSYEVFRVGDANIPFIAASVSSPGFSGHVIAVHFVPPIPGDDFALRGRQLAELQTYLQQLRGPYIVIGDFNNTPASPSMQEFMAATSTYVAMPSWIPTWPVQLGWAGIPIDFVLGPGSVEFQKVTRLPGIGSDHRGIRVSVSQADPADL